MLRIKIHSWDGGEGEVLGGEVDRDVDLALLLGLLALHLGPLTLSIQKLVVNILEKCKGQGWFITKIALRGNMLNFF